MKTVLLFKEIYSDQFRSIKNYVVRNYFKAFTWFTMAMFAMVLYVFLFRLFTDFPFANF
ncbi:hypothetical protein HZY62_13875 [Maribacter polysiphoniae]|uniref:Uncharacterized protein n=1 Tax=Maribacter polysiphoniae TaxID=429344 RepID=A0A316DVX5_9FLAO|nr:DUF6747 family protein [Maribacter polysiphoniae]MBD1261689.1 hypothetical protein [Maribacter polysiphoniae]PWK22507.1 hypothetical protein LX92_02982 [Maribacter polysiphoniae]